MECDEVRPCLGYSRSILPFTIRRAAPEGRRTEPGATRVNGRERNEIGDSHGFSLLSHVVCSVHH